MNRKLSISHGQCSIKGRKKINQDACGVLCPKEPLLSTKGVAMALADGISSSQVSQEASQSAVNNFLEDYYNTSETWSVKKSGQYVLQAINSWLYSQTRRSEYRYNLEKGYVCTFSCIIIKSSTAHIFHSGDSRIYLLRNKTLEKITEEHRVYLSKDQHYLKRALGIDNELKCDYHDILLEQGDVFILTTDGIFEFVNDDEIVNICTQYSNELELAAQAITNLAYDNGSDDNLTVQILRADELPKQEANELYEGLRDLPFPSILKPRDSIDGFTIIRQIYSSARSHVYLAIEEETQTKVIIKTLSQEMQENKGHMERFLLEEWIARRINNLHVLKPCEQKRPRSYFYIALEYIEGKTLQQWMIDNPAPSIESVREIIEQIAKGLMAFHRLEMLHQDLRPANIMIDTAGTVKIIDFGSTWVAGLEEMTSPYLTDEILGTAQYTAPEYFLGEKGTRLSDQFSLAVITYQMLCGRLPYGVEVAKARSIQAQRRLKYRSVLDEKSEIPAWIDFTLRKALNPNPEKRYDVISEFLYDLKKPNKEFINQTRPPLIERNPVQFWQGLCAILFLIIVFLLSKQ